MAENPLRRGVVERPEIGLVDDAVAILIHVEVLLVDGTIRYTVNPISIHVLVDRLPVFPNVLVDVERVDRHARGKDLDSGSYAAGDVADQNLEARSGERSDGLEGVGIAGQG